MYVYIFYIRIYILDIILNLNHFADFSEYFVQAVWNVTDFLSYDATFVFLILRIFKMCFKLKIALNFFQKWVYLIKKFSNWIFLKKIIKIKGNIEKPGINFIRLIFNFCSLIKMLDRKTLLIWHSLITLTAYTHRYQND